MGLEEVLAQELPGTEVGVLTAYTDGSCLDNGSVRARGGYAVVFDEYPGMEFAWNMDDGVPPTNNRAEFYGWLAACGVADKLDPVDDSLEDAVARRRTLVIHTDSELLVNTATTWATGWVKNGYRKKDGGVVMNRDLVERINTQLARRAIVTLHVRGHTGGTDRSSIANARADRLAHTSAERQSQILGVYERVTA